MPGKQKTIVVVDDEPQVLSLLEAYLAQSGFTVLTAHSGAALDHVLAAQPVDLVLLDVMLGNENGFTIADRLRQNRPEIGIIMLTAKGEESDRVAGLELGADDYIAKPFSLREIVARVRSVLRRSPRAPVLPAPSNTQMRFGRWIVDLNRRRLSTLDGQDIPLSAGEYVLLRAFIDHAGQVLTREQLIELTRVFGHDPMGRAIDVQVARLRQKIEVNPRAPEIIKTVRGGGYLFGPAVTTA